MILRRTIPKEDLRQMPRVDYCGKIHIINTPDEAERAVAYLKKSQIVGIDTETRPSFSKGRQHKVSLLQVANEEHCFLFRLHLTGLTFPMITLLENPKIIKVGLSLKDDFHMLRQRAPFEPHGIIELQEYVNNFGIKEKSLQKIFGILFGMKISKGQRLSNWEAGSLSNAQQQYAAIDAWACLKIYNLLEELNKTGDFIIEESEEEVISETQKQEDK